MTTVENEETFTLPKLPDGQRWLVRKHEDYYWGETTVKYYVHLEEYREDGRDTWVKKLIDTPETKTHRFLWWTWETTYTKSVEREVRVSVPDWVRVSTEDLMDEDGDYVKYLTAEIVASGAEKALEKYNEQLRVDALKSESDKFVGAYPPLKLEDLS